MEKEEKDLLERLVKEVATQNKLLAMLLSFNFGVTNWGFISEKEQFEQIQKKSNQIFEWVSNKTLKSDSL